MFGRIRKAMNYPVYKSPYQRKLEEENIKLSEVVAEKEGEVQEAYRVVDILSATAVELESDAGNQYPTKTLAVDETYKKYQNLSQYGCPFVQRVINQRKALVMPYGVKLQLSEKAIREKYAATEEMKYLDRVMDWNDFYEDREDTFCRYAEMEGQMLVMLDWNEDGDGESGLPRIKRVSWKDKHYEVVTKIDDPDEVAEIFWDVQGTVIDKRTLIPNAKPYWSYVAFNDVNLAGTPVVSLILGNCENVDKSLGGWRKMNKFFGKLTPFFKAETWQEAQAIMQWIKKTGWTCGTGFAGRGMELVGPDAASADTIYKEIRANMQVISGTTGIPIHYLGFADVLSSRATANSLTEPMEVLALTDVTKWRSFYEDMFDKCILLRNEELTSDLKPGMVKPKLIPVTDRQYERLRRFWMPARKDGLVSKELFISQLPDIDNAEELKRQNTQQLEDLFKEGDETLDQEFWEAVLPTLKK